MQENTPFLTLVTALALALPTMGNAQAGARQGQAFAKADANGDGVITQAEIEARKAAIFARIDTNGDGLIDPNEAQRIKRRIQRSADATSLGLEAADRNGDGMVSEAEFITHNPMFAAADTDGNGQLTSSEISRMRSTIQN